MEWDFISDIVNTLLHSHSSTTTTTTITNSSFSSSLFLEFLTLVPQEIQQIIQSASVVAGSTTSIPSLSTSSSPSSSILLSPMKQRVLESLVLSHIDSTVLPLLSGIILNSEEGGGGGGESGHEMKQKAFVCAASYGKNKSRLQDEYFTLSFTTSSLSLFLTHTHTQSRLDFQPHISPPSFASRCTAFKLHLHNLNQMIPSLLQSPQQQI